MTYGPGTTDITKIIPHTLLSVKNKIIPKYTSGSRKTDWIYIDDVVKGLIAVSIVPNIEGKTIDIGTGELYSIKEVIDYIFTILDTEIQPQFGLLPDRPFESEVAANIEETEYLLGWRPRVKLLDGLHRTVRWFQDSFS
jgi:nucleoside-diphosphate-sugar epimerase